MLAGSVLTLAASIFASAALVQPPAGAAREWWPFVVSLVVAVFGLALVVMGLLEDKPR